MEQAAERGSAGPPPTSALALQPPRRAALEAAAADLAATPRQIAYMTEVWGEEGAKPVSKRPGDAAGLTPVRPPPLPADLNQGYPDYYVQSDGVACVGELAALAGPASVWRADVVTYRNNLNKVFGSVVDPKEEWQVHAVALHPAAGDRTPPATVFLEMVREPRAAFPGADRFEYWGSKFEALCSPTPDAPAREGGTDFISVVERRVGGLSVVVGSEIDGFETRDGALPPDHPNPATYVELKTLRWPQPGRERSLATFKMAKWWLQSWLAGVPRIIMGGRDGDGMLVRLDAVATADVPRFAASKGATWTPAGLVASGGEMLAWMVETARCQPGAALRFEYARGVVTARPLDDGGELAARVKAAVGA